MKSSLLRIALVIVCAGMLPIVVSAQKVNVDYDKNVDFSKFKTYAWQPGQPAPNPLTHKRILNAVETTLASRGWTKADSSPTAIVIYYAAVGEQRQLNAWGAGPRWAGSGTVRVDTIRIGQLVVDVYDAASKELLWRGAVSDTVSDNAGKNEKKLNDAVAKLFKEFPPARASRSSHD